MFASLSGRRVDQYTTTLVSGQCRCVAPATATHLRRQGVRISCAIRLLWVQFRGLFCAKIEVETLERGESEGYSLKETGGWETPLQQDR
jgi:hypothetical protein